MVKLQKNATKVVLFCQIDNEIDAFLLSYADSPIDLF